MENETKYSLIIIGVALVALIAFNYNNFYTGQTIVKSAPTTYQQERLNLVRSFVGFPNTVSQGDTVKIVFASTNPDDLIQTNKEKIFIYKVGSSGLRVKDQISYPRCTDGYASACNRAEKSFSVPFSWEDGNYQIQIEREARNDDKVMTEVVGRVSFTLI